jgi:hypothetical protein
MHMTHKRESEISPLMGYSFCALDVNSHLKFKKLGKKNKKNFENILVIYKKNFEKFW